MDHRRELDYTTWEGLEPDDQGGEDCLEVYPSGLWNDIPCDRNPYTQGFVCEFGGLDAGDTGVADPGHVARNARSPWSCRLERTSCLLPVRTGT